MATDYVKMLKDLEDRLIERIDALQEALAEQHEEFNDRLDRMEREIYADRETYD